MSFFPVSVASFYIDEWMLPIDYLEEESKLIEAAFQYVLCSEEDDAAIYRQKNI
jgi:hypothetical protein